jgi:DNA polymerase zeta
MKRNPHSPNSQFVRAILLVKGVHFYGFHTSYSPFLKILLVDPTFVSRAVTVMRAGTVMHTHFNVYESHLSYILQFLCDFGLYGCGWMNLGEVWQRGQDEEEAGQGDGNIVRGFNVSPHFRQSRLPLEVDAAAHQILNRHLLVARNLHHKLTIPSPVSSPEPLVISVRELWEDERRRRLAKGLSPSPEIPVDPSESSRGPGGEWIAEARWWDEVRKRIEKEREGDVQMREGGKGWERFVMTTFESIEALWEQEWKVWRHGPRESGEAEVSKPEDGNDEGRREENPFGSAGGCGSWDQTDSKRQNTEVDVDEALLSSQEMSRMVALDEQEWARLMGENRAIENEDDDVYEGQFDEDDDYFLSDDGPPPVLQGDNATTHASQQRFSKNDSLVATSPKTPRKRQNTLQDDSSR